MAIFGSQFYHQTIRRYVIAFGNMFNDMVVQRINNAGQVVQTLSVPIAYGPKEKFLVRISQDPDLDRAVAISLPRMGFEMTSVTYDSTRRLPATIKNVHVVDDKNKLNYQYVPVPWNFNFTLSIFVQNGDDGAQILEQILPYFGPEWVNNIKLIPSMDIVMDVPCILNSVSTEDTYEGDFETRRALIYTLDFTMKGYIYGPVRRGGIIKRSQIDLGIVAANTGNRITLADASQTGRSSRIVVTPGLLANGSPTTNSSASVPYLTIDADDDYGFAVDTFFYTNGLKYNPRTGNDEPIE